MTLLRVLFRIPWHILLIAAVLVIVGALALYSASEGSLQPWAGRHALRGAIGVGIILLMAFIDFKLVHRFSYVLLILALIILAGLLVIGSGPNVSRWITIGGVSFQPSEPAKIAITLALARYFDSQPQDRMQSLIVYLPALAIIAVPFLLVMKQPDLGTAMMLLLGGLSVIFAAGLPWRYVGGATILALGAMPLLWMSLHDYQKSRVITFLHPEADVLGAGYQIIQSKIALGSGGLFGKGFLMGSQSQLNYLPEKQTDFVFTMIGEEFGLVGNLFILGLYLALSLSILRISYLVRSRFSQLTCVGISMMVFFYVFVNVAMVSGMLPVVGAPLPLISYGGTSMLTVFIGLGIVTSILIHDRQED